MVAIGDVAPEVVAPTTHGTGLLIEIEAREAAPLGQCRIHFGVASGSAKLGSCDEKMWARRGERVPFVCGTA